MPSKEATGMQMRHRRSLISCVIVITALLAGIASFVMLASLKKPAVARVPEPRVFNVEVFEVHPRNIQEIVSTFGTARSDRTVVVSAQVSGEIVRLHPRLEVGHAVDGPRLKVPESGAAWPETALGAFNLVSVFDSVLALAHLGEHLVEIDPRTYLERVDQARSRLIEDDAEIKRLRQEAINNRRQLSKVQADVDTYEKELSRMRDLRRKNAVTASQLATAEVEMRRYEIAYLQRQDEQELYPIKVEQAEKRRATHRADLEMAQFDMTRTDIRAPFSGRISEVFVEQGQFVRVGDPLVRMTDIRRVEVPLPVTLTDYARIEPLLSRPDGIRVEFADRVDSSARSSKQPRWVGRIRRVSPEVDESTRTVMLYAIVDNEADVNRNAPDLLAGTFLHASIFGQEQLGALAVPRDALVDGKALVVRSVKGGDQSDSTTPGGDATRSGEVEIVPVTTDMHLHSLAILQRTANGQAGVRDGSLVILTNLDVLHELLRKNRRRDRNTAPAVSFDFQAKRLIDDEIEGQVPEVVRLLEDADADSRSGQ